MSVEDTAMTKSNNGAEVQIIPEIIINEDISMNQSKPNLQIKNLSHEEIINNALAKLNLREGASKQNKEDKEENVEKITARNVFRKDSVETSHDSIENGKKESSNENDMQKQEVENGKVKSSKQRKLSNAKENFFNDIRNMENVNTNGIEVIEEENSEKSSISKSKGN